MKASLTLFALLILCAITAAIYYEQRQSVTREAARIDQAAQLVRVNAARTELAARLAQDDAAVERSIKARRALAESERSEIAR
jgi:hypothetical protein